MELRPALLSAVPPTRPARRFGAAVAALALLSAAPWALGQAAPALSLPPQAIAEALALARDAASAAAPAGARIEVQAGRPDPRLRLAPCERVAAQLAPGAPAWGRTRVGLRCVQGPVAWNIYLPVTVQVFALALAPRATLPAGALLNEADLDTVSVDWGASVVPPLADKRNVVGRALARPVPAGQPLQASDLRRRQWFVNGDAVRLVVRGPGFSIAAEGLALGDGLEGQPVRVRLSSVQDDGQPTRVVIGRATGQRLVEVGP